MKSCDRLLVSYLVVVAPEDPQLLLRALERLPARHLHHLNAKFIILNREFNILDTKFIILNFKKSSI